MKILSNLCALICASLASCGVATPKGVAWVGGRINAAGSGGEDGNFSVEADSEKSLNDVVVGAVSYGMARLLAEVEKAKTAAGSKDLATKEGGKTAREQIKTDEALGLDGGTTDRKALDQ